MPDFSVFHHNTTHTVFKQFDSFQNELDSNHSQKHDYTSCDRCHSNGKRNVNAPFQ